MNFLKLTDLIQFNDVPNDNSRFLDLVMSNNKCDLVRANDLLLPEDRHHPSLEICFKYSTPSNKN